MAILELLHNCLFVSSEELKPTAWFLSSEELKLTCAMQKLRQNSRTT